MIALRWLKIHRFRRVMPGTHIEFGKGLVAILGKNGSGKTTLLELLSAIWAWDFSMFASEEIHIEYEFGIENKNTSILIQLENKKPPQLPRIADPYRGKSPRADLLETCKITLMTSQEPPFEYTIQEGWLESPQEIIETSMFGPDKSGAGPKPKGLSGWASNPRYAFKLFEIDELHQVVNLKQNHYRFAEDNYFISIIRNSSSIMPQMISVDKAEGISSYYIPLTNENHVAHQMINPSDLPSSIKLTRADIVAIDDACQKLRLRNIEFLYNLVLLEKSHDFLDNKNVIQQFQYNNPQIYVTNSEGARFPIEQLSHGEKRFIGLLWYLYMMPSAVFIDELANGLHHSLIEYIIEKINGRQAFIAMQDPLVLDHIDLHSAEAARTGFVLCESSEDENQSRRWYWKNCSPEEAQELFESWQVGIQHTSELLKVRGLW